MRVFIAVDMEGVAGVVHSEQTRPNAPEWEQSRRLMTAEANAAIEGAIAAGADNIVVSDCHWDMRNVLPEELHPAAELIQGAPRPWSMVEGLDASFDAFCMIGQHARAGTHSAVIDHTYTGSILNVRLNDQLVGEIGLNAAFAGYHGVPLVLVSGDQHAVAEAQALLGANLIGVVVKHGLARSGARSLAPQLARDRIRTAVTEALRTPHEPWHPSSPITLTVDFMRTSQADLAEMLPGAERSGPRTVQYTHADYLMVFRAWRVLFTITSDA